jgi:curved DNA-binding protein CbpA
MLDPYEILGVGRDATQEEIISAFKELVKLTHPDHGGDEAEFAKVKAAGDILRDPKKRKLYDEDGFSWQDRPDTINSMAMEKVANFFINSIDATLDGNVSLDGLDLIKGATGFFDLQIRESNNQIERLKRRVKQYEKAIKRLRTKRKNDVIKNLLTNHIATVKHNIASNEEQIKIAVKAKEILSDYEFTQEQTIGLLNPHIQWKFP